MVLSYNCLCFFKRRQSPLNLQILVSGDALDNPAFFYEQLEFIWLLGFFGASIQARCEIDAPGRHPVMLYDPLVR